MLGTNQEVLQLGNPQLRQAAQPITDPHDPTLQRLIDNLMETMQQANGVGIAAPQIGVPLQVIIVASRPTLRYPHAPQMDAIALVNPRILEQEPEQIKDWEGCLSVPGMRGLVPRSPRITVVYLDRYGQSHQQSFRDFVARIIQHECDHLQGYVFIDRMTSTRELITENEYHKLLIPS
jgi:peptide deformylase